MSAPAYMGPGLAEALLDAAESVAAALDPEVPVRFEELTADPGELPRLMLAPAPDQGSEPFRYISGEAVYPLRLNAYLRMGAPDGQSRLDAHRYLSAFAEALMAETLAVDGYVAVRKPMATAPSCLGVADRFEDWQVTLDLTFKQTER